MAMIFRGKRRIGETYIKCKCVGVTNEPDWKLKYIYEPVNGTGTIVMELPDEPGDNVVPIEHLRMKTQVEILTKLNYPVEDICRILGAPEYLIDFYMPVGYVGLDENNIYNKFHRINERSTKLKEELESERADRIQFENRGKALTAENAKLNEELESAMADKLYLENRRKELIEKADILTSQIDALECKVAELTKENARLKASLESEEEANDILTKRIDEANNEIDDLKERYRTLQAECVGISGTSICCAEEKENLTKQLSDLRNAYDRIYRSKEEHVKHIEALKHKVEELEREKRDMESMYACVNEELCKARKECEKLNKRVGAYNIIMQAHIDASCIKHNALELGKWIRTSVDALRRDGKTTSEIADILETTEPFVEYIINDFLGGMTSGI